MFNFRKIASVLASTVMLGSSVAIAAAAAFPAPYVSGGSADVAVVYGANAASSDLVAVADITSALSTELAKQTASAASSTTTVTGGDYIKLAKSSDNVNLGNNLRTVFGSTVSRDDLKVLLADGVYKNRESTEYEFEQRVTLGSALVYSYFSDSDYKDRTPSLGINLSSNHVVLNYTLDFTDNPESDIVSSDLDDIETTYLDILGRSYYVLDAKNSTLDMTLLDTAVSDTLAEGETKTVKLGDKSYEIKADIITATEVKLTVNGVGLTRALQEGQTQKVDGGAYVGIRDIVAQDYAGGSKSVDFSIGKGKLKIYGGGSAIELNDNSVEDVKSYVSRGTSSGGKESVDKIILEWKTNDEAYLTPEAELVMPGFGALKFSMSQTVMPSTEVTTIEDGSSDYVQIKTEIKDGPVTIPILQANSSGEFQMIGKDSSNRLVTTNNLELIFNESYGDEWFVASWNSSTEAESYLLSMAFTTENGINKTSIYKWENGEKRADPVCKDKRPGDTCTLGSLTLNIDKVFKQGSEKHANLSVAGDCAFNHLYTATGLKIFLPYNVTDDTVINTTRGAINFNNINTSASHNPLSYAIYFVEENKDDNIASGSNFNITVDDNSDSEVSVTTVDAGRQTISDPEDSNHQYTRIPSDLGTLIERFGSSSDQRTAKITYAGSESYADFVLSAPEAAVSGSTSGASAKELGSVSFKDSESASVSGKNLIVVGGSCINSVAAKMLGSDTPLCTADFTTKTGVSAGQFLIESAASPLNSAKVATLVAGYNAADTTNAATYLRTKAPDTSVGKKYIGTTATEATLQTA